MSDQPTNTNTTILGPDCRINGEVTLDNDAVIMGQFQGTLKVSGELEIAESAQITGSIMAGTMRLSGQVEANVAAENGIEILPGGQLIGKLYTTNLQIVEGAIFQGDVYVGTDAMERAQIEPEDKQLESRKTRPRRLMGQRQDQRQADTTRRPTSDGSPIRTVPSALDSVLQKRRAAKVLSHTGQVGASGSASTASTSQAAKGGPTDES